MSFCSYLIVVYISNENTTNWIICFSSEFEKSKALHHPLVKLSLCKKYIKTHLSYETLQSAKLSVEEEQNTKIAPKSDKLVSNVNAGILELYRVTWLCSLKKSLQSLFTPLGKVLFER